MNDSHESQELLRLAREDDRQALGDLLTRHRTRLERMVDLRLDPRIRDRFDPADVVQEACVQAVRRLPEYARDPSMPFFLWLRYLTGQELLALHRRHLGAEMRDVRRQVPLRRHDFPEASADSVSDQLVRSMTTPSQVAAREEVRGRVREALDRLDPSDREVLLLRHFEQLSNAEVAEELGLKESAASKRYLRALQDLKAALAGLPGGLEGLAP